MQEGIWFIGQLPSLCLEADQAFNLTSFALSLLLVFRTNTSYSRWLDARKIWGGILNRSRDIVRQVSARCVLSPTAPLPAVLFEERLPVSVCKWKTACVSVVSKRWKDSTVKMRCGIPGPPFCHAHGRRGSSNGPHMDQCPIKARAITLLLCLAPPCSSYYGINDKLVHGLTPLWPGLH